MPLEPTEFSRSLEETLQERTGLLQLQQVIAVTANESRSAAEALQGILTLVCAYIGWPVGHAQLFGDGTAPDEQAVNLWFTRDPARYATFPAAVTAARGAAQPGLLAQIIAAQQAVWAPDLTAHAGCPCHSPAKVAGLAGYVAAPIRAGDVTVGAIEFFSDRAQPRDERLIQMLQFVSAQAGRVCERQRMEARLRQSEAYFRSVVENSSDIITILNLAGAFQYVSPAAETALGRVPAELVGRSAFELIHPDDVRRTWSVFHEALQNPNVAQTVEFRFQHADGSWRSLEARGRSVRRPDGAVEVTISARDITERKRAEADLRASHQQLEAALDELRATQQQVVQQERLRALGTMASGIAHDFNNALAPILGFSELLLHRPGTLADRAKTERYLQLINTAAQDAGRVVRRLREFYRQREPGELQGLVDLGQLVEEALALTEPKWGPQAQAKGVAINVVKQLAPTPPISGNEADLREALTNLIFNAVDAMPRGGALTVSVGCEAGVAQLTVADTGVGMTEDVRRRCLEPFFTTKGAGGTGLGLSMVYGIVQRHGGRVEIESAPGRGARFVIQLPLLGAPAPADEPSPAREPTVTQRVLLIDDDPSVRMIMGEMLGALGHQPTLAESGHAGLELFRQHGADVVVVDRAMPGMNGDQIAAAIKGAAPHTPVILLTGFGSMMLAAGEHPAGVDLVLGKPVTLDELRRALDEVSAPAGG